MDWIPDAVHALTPVLRWLNALLAVAAAMALLATTIDHWDELSTRMRRICCWFCVVMAVGAYGSGEAAAQGAPFGIRVFLFMISASGLLGALVWPERRRPDTTP